MVITQTYDYMIQSGVAHGYISTGKAYIFLRLEENDPTTVYYHLIEPGEAINPTNDAKSRAFDTAVAQVLCFTLLAFESERKKSSWREWWKRELSKWPTSEQLAQERAMMPETPKRSSSNPSSPKLPTPETASSEFKGKSSKTKRAQNKAKPKPKARGVCMDEGVTSGIRHGDDSDDSDKGGRFRPHETPTRPSQTVVDSPNSSPPVSSRTRNQGRQQAADSRTRPYRTKATARSCCAKTTARSCCIKAAARSFRTQAAIRSCCSPVVVAFQPKSYYPPSAAPTRIRSYCPPVAVPTRIRSYCTQACLLGLVRGGKLDENCPNVLEHQEGEVIHQENERLHQEDKGQYHPIGVKELMRLVREQLGRTLDQDCDPLWLQGARGILFKIQLVSHGYTFVGKGTISVFVKDLQHEARMYGQLQRLQGEVIPVYLGSIGMIRPYVDVGVEIVHMLLMSWGGVSVRSVKDSVKGLDINWFGAYWDRSEEVRRSVEEIWEEGVDHNDVRLENMLWNEERRRVMMVDFERSVIIQERAREEAQVEAKARAKAKAQAAQAQTGLQEVSGNRKSWKLAS